MRNKMSLGVLMICGMLTLTACNKTVAVVEESVATPVEVTVVSKSLIKNEYVYSGKVKPINEVNVLSTVNGIVDTVNFDVGDTVSKGDVLFTMKTEDINNNINTLNASLASSQANINSAKISLELVNGASMLSQIEGAKASISNAEIAVNNAEIGISNAEMALVNAEINYNNNKALYEINAVSKTVLDQTEMAYNQAQNTATSAKNALSQAGVAYNQAKENYNIIANKMPVENQKKAEAALKIAEASRGSVLAQIESAKKSLRDANITAPIAGVVTANNVKAGTVLSQSAAPFTIIDTSKVTINVSVSEQMINSVKMDDAVEVKIATVSAENITGKVSSINPAATTAGTYDIKIEIDNRSGLLKSGMLGEVYFVREKNNHVVVLSRSSVLTKDNEMYVFVEENGIANKVVVTTGIDNGNEIEIISGIEENTNVITKGQNYLTDGDAVSISSNTKGE